MMDSAHRIIEMNKLLSLSPERSPFIKEIAGAPKEWKINRCRVEKTFGKRRH